MNLEKRREIIVLCRINWREWGGGGWLGVCDFKPKLVCKFGEIGCDMFRKKKKTWEIIALCRINLWWWGAPLPKKKMGLRGTFMLVCKMCYSVKV